MDLKLRRDESGVIIIEIKGEIDLYFAPELKEYFNKVISKNGLHIVANLKDVSYIDSSGCAAFVAVLKGLKTRQGSLKFCHIQSNIKKLFSLAKLDSIFEVFDLEEEAIAVSKEEF